MRDRDDTSFTPALGSIAAACLKSDDPYRQAELAEKTSARAGRWLRTKATVPAGRSSSLPELAGLSDVSNTFLGSLRNAGAFLTALPDFRPQPPYVRSITISTDVVANSANSGTAGDALPTPLTSIDLSSSAPEPLLASTLIVISKELAESDAAVGILEREIRRALPKAIDSVFFAALTAAGADSNVSAGSGAEDSLRDVGLLLADVGATSESRLYFASAANVMRGASTLALDAISLRTWPNIGPTGGELLPGVEAVVSDALSSGQGWLFDASRIAASLLDIEITKSSETSLELKDGSLTQSGAAATGASLVNLWQNNLLAIRARAWFTCKPSGSTAAAALTSIGWTGATSAAS